MKSHWDTAAIIAVNLALAAIFLTLLSTHNSQICALNSRIDSTQSLIYLDMKDFHGRLCSIEERNKK